MKYKIEKDLKIGIYKITNTKNNKVYVGKTKDFKNRHRQYVYDYENRRNDHINDYLLSSFYKYGFENFDYECLESFEILDEEVLRDRELYWMDELNSYDRTCGYNFRRDSSTGMITHSETSKKISNNLKRQWAEGMREGHSDKLKESWSRNPERKETQSKLLTKTLTKWVYKLYNEDGTFITDCSYQGLVKRGLKNVIAKFHKRKCDKASFKSYIIHRVKI